MNRYIQRMKKIPGKHAVSDLFSWARGKYVVVEVDADGKVYQLTPEGERDGELDDEGWARNVFVLELATLED